MCGIAGYYCTNKFDDRLRIALPLLAVFMQSRGKHSWGWTDGKNIRKEIGAIEDDLDFDMAGQKHVILHTRHATTGKISKENSHPFIAGKILGVHNGIVYNHDELNAKYGRNCTVDSQHLLHHIDEGLPMDDIEAYGTVVFFKDGLIHFGKFNGGEFCVGKFNKNFIFASTKDAVINAARASGIKNLTIYELKEGLCYKIKNGEVYKEPSIDMKPQKGVSSLTWESFSGYSYKGSQPAKEGAGASAAGFHWDDAYLYEACDLCYKPLWSQYFTATQRTSEFEAGAIVCPGCAAVSEFDQYLDGPSSNYRVNESDEEDTDHPSIGTKVSCEWCGDPIAPREDCYVTPDQNILCIGCADALQEEMMYSGEHLTLVKFD